MGQKPYIPLLQVAGKVGSITNIYICFSPRVFTLYFVGDIFATVINLHPRSNVKDKTGVSCQTGTGEDQRK